MSETLDQSRHADGAVYPNLVMFTSGNNGYSLAPSWPQTNSIAYLVGIALFTFPLVLLDEYLDHSGGSWIRYPLAWLVWPLIMWYPYRCFFRLTRCYDPPRTGTYAERSRAVKEEDDETRRYARAALPGRLLGRRLKKLIGSDQLTGILGANDAQILERCAGLVLDANYSLNRIRESQGQRRPVLDGNALRVHRRVILVFYRALESVKGVVSGERIAGSGERGTLEAAEAELSKLLAAIQTWESSIAGADFPWNAGQPVQPPPTLFA